MGKGAGAQWKHSLFQERQDMEIPQAADRQTLSIPRFDSGFNGKHQRQRISGKRILYPLYTEKYLE